MNILHSISVESVPSSKSVIQTIDGNAVYKARTLLGFAKLIIE